MKAIRFSEDKGLRLEVVEKPSPAPGEALVKVLRAGVCSTDLEIIKGYVPGFDHTLGHEFVGLVESVVAGDGDSSRAAAAQRLVGQRCVGEINCKSKSSGSGNKQVVKSHWNAEHQRIFIRNHFPDRTVLGIIARDGCMAEYCCLPIENLHAVPDDVSDMEACFAEPLAAACRIAEQGLVHSVADSVAVVGDGKLGLLVAHVLSCATKVNGDKQADKQPNVTLFGRHLDKMNLVENINRVVVEDLVEDLHRFHGQFDVVVDASGSPQGITLAMSLTRPLGTLVLKSTCSGRGVERMPEWTALANDIVVNEKKVIGSRCGPFEPALALLSDPQTKQLVKRMLSATLPVDPCGLEAIQTAQKKGTLKVQICFNSK